MYKLLSPLSSSYSLVARVLACGLLLSFFSVANANTAEKIPDVNFTISTNATAANTKYQKNYFDALVGGHSFIRTDQFLPEKLMQ